jgi:ribonuclease R
MDKNGKDNRHRHDHTHSHDHSHDHKRRHIPKKKEYGGTLRSEKEPKQRVGLFSAKRQGGFLGPCHRKDPFSGIYINSLQAKSFNEDEVIVYSISKEGEFQFIRNLGSIHNAKTYAQMGVYAYHLPHVFSEDAQHLADKGTVPELGKRTDLRNLPLVTIDGADAKDFDDAVFAESDPDPRNQGGWRAIVAIADVSHYVQSGDALDKEAHLRGNSVYFVDRVVPMLPEQLSNNLCSLRPNQDRACLAVDMVIDKNGKIKSYRFKRALMRSRARLTYEQVELALNGKTDTTTEPLLTDVINPLYGCYKTLKKARDLRGTIQVEKIENTFELGDDGSIQAVKARSRLESHQLIEELMIAANVAAAKTLQAKDWPTIYRIHERPDKTRLQSLYTLAKSLKLPVRKFSGTNLIGSINDLLHLAKNLPYFRLFNELVLRSQAQARYSPHNMGHFGLNLSAYCHFTSPIRRYADLVVHRSLVSALELDGTKHQPVDLDLTEVSEHISKTERTAMEAEREVQDRFMAHYMKDRLGDIFDGTIVGVGIPGIFIELDNIGAQGFIPKQDLDGDYFILYETQHSYVGRHTREIYQIGNRVKVMVTNADPIICSIGFSLVKNKKEKLSAKKPQPKSDKSPGNSTEKNYKSKSSIIKNKTNK